MTQVTEESILERVGRARRDALGIENEEARARAVDVEGDGEGLGSVTKRAKLSDHIESG